MVTLRASVVEYTIAVTTTLKYAEVYLPIDLEMLAESLMNP